MKRLSILRQLPCAVALAVGCAICVPQVVVAQNHVVSPGQIQNDVTSSSAARQRNEQELRNFFSTKEAQQALKSDHIDPQQVTNAISQLSNRDLANLTARTQKAQSDFAAGRISNRMLLFVTATAAILILLVVLF